ncbi:MurR/RpiR family transcriptional regulator [Vibrio sp.]|nr:MurR/RpiR family transcriptional regulator [Vibrio sp.]
MNTFKGTERIIYEYLIAHALDLPSTPSKEIAAHAMSTTTSVNRVCKKMGYVSYTELRYKLAGDLTTQINKNKPVTLPIDDHFSSFTSILKGSRVVYLYSRGASIVSASYLSRFLSLTNVPHLMITDIHQLGQVHAGTLFLISQSGETDAVVNMAHNAKRKGLKVLGITREGSTLASFCHKTIVMEGNIDGVSLYNRESQIKTLSIIDQLGKTLLSPSS